MSGEQLDLMPHPAAAQAAALAAAAAAFDAGLPVAAAWGGGMCMACRGLYEPGDLIVKAAPPPSRRKDGLDCWGANHATCATGQAPARST